MKRYLGSFFITAFIYFAFAGGFYYLYSTTEIKNKKDVSIKKISLNHVEIKSAPKEVQEVKKEIIKPKVKKENKVIKQKIKPIKKKKIVKKRKLKTKKTVKSKPKKVQKTIKTTQVPNINKPVKIVKKQTPVIKKDPKKEFLKKHLSEIRALINKNIKYPKRARKLNIQGIVSVKFKILKNGKLGEIQILSGHKFLKKSTIQAIKNASINFPKTTTDIDIKIPISYKLI